MPWRLRPRLTAPGAKVLSVLEAGDVPRDIAIKFGPSEVLYVNGPLSEIEAEEYWLAVVERWAGVRFHRFAAGPHCMASRLCGGDTDFLVCFNEDITEPCKLRLAVPAKAVPLAEATVLSRDGDGYQPLATTQQEGEYRARDDLRYYGVYQFAFSPVKIETPALVLQPGQNKAFSVEATNLTSRTVRGRIEASGIIPTISGEPAEVELTPGETKTVALRIGASPTVDWGRKTISIELGFDGRRAVVLRELIVEKPAGVELVDVVVSADEPQVELCVPESPFGQTAVLRDARLAFEGHMIEVPTVEPGGRCRVALPPLDLPAPREPALEARTLRIDLGRPHGPEATDYEVLLARKPNTYRGPPDATAALVVFNPRTSPLKHELLTVRIPGGPGAYCVRTEAGEAVPSQIDASGRLRFLATVPGRSGRTFYLCRSEAEAAGDLHCSADRLATGQGTLRIDNSQLSVTLSEAAGGTVTSLRHLKTGRDYGRKSFGVNYGTFSQYDPTQPRTDTRRYVKESKVRQEDLPGRIELVSQGPAVAVARVRWADERVRVEQTYEFRAYQPFFLIHQRVRPVSLDGQQELVAFNAQFQAHRLTKCFPNFDGIPSGDEQPHFGWRQGAWVPDYATLMTPPDFEESLSLVITRKQGLIGIRQGFWPAERPRAGKRQIAQIELTADKTAGCDAEIYVLLHARHQIVAKQFLADLRLAPRVEVVDKLNGRDHN